ncbi:hypothetical protein CHUAL_001704 [Chamberlinius hualienensis]
MNSLRVHLRRCRNCHLQKYSIPVTNCNKCNLRVNKRYFETSEAKIVPRREQAGMTLIHIIVVGDAGMAYCALCNMLGLCHCSKTAFIILSSKPAIMGIYPAYIYRSFCRDLNRSHVTICGMFSYQEEDIPDVYNTPLFLPNYGILRIFFADGNEWYLMMVGHSAVNL